MDWKKFTKQSLKNLKNTVKNMKNTMGKYSTKPKRTKSNKQWRKVMSNHLPDNNEHGCRGKQSAATRRSSWRKKEVNRVGILGNGEKVRRRREFQN